MTCFYSRPSPSLIGEICGESLVARDQQRLTVRSLTRSNPPIISLYRWNQPPARVHQTCTIMRTSELRRLPEIYLRRHLFICFGCFLLLLLLFCFYFIFYGSDEDVCFVQNQSVQEVSQYVDTGTGNKRNRT